MIRFPIFFLMKDCGEVDRAGSLQELRNQLEPIDVENGEYDVWDAQGRRLRLRFARAEDLQLEPTEEIDITGLRHALMDHARQKGVDDASLLESDPLALFERIRASDSRGSWLRVIRRLRRQ